ncbi:septation ring formation regulator EzrA [Metabacillus litoralis]|uniref:Septation ring formation regulator EzrA n=1 Tax=Metabacillus litoralis TaxID=152268 RepID=A0A5C6W307_9BACI|nr:septation ring formation regulator EzrA [Metabacillus litoralis]TXC90230.1 septation ring formation regulator EzrA [Metabacillus litoralis]
MEVIIGLVLLICILFGTGYVLRRKIYKEVDRLEARKIEIMNRSIIDELSKVKELKMIGQAEELFEQWRDEWDEIITSQLPEVEELLFDAEDYADKYRFKKSKSVLEHIDEVLRTVDDNIDKIILEINELVSSEEENSLESEEVKEQTKKMRKTLLAHSHQFGKSHSKLEDTLDEITSALKQFDIETEQGNYLVARDLLKNTMKNVDTLQVKIDEIPKLLTECHTTIPNLLHELEDGYKEMIATGYYLEHLQVDEEIRKVREKLSLISQKIEDTETEDIQEGLQLLQESIDQLYDLLEKEVEASQFVKQSKNKIDQQLEKLSEQKTATLLETDLVKQSYQLSETESEKQKVIEKQISQIEKKFVHIQQNLQSDHVAHSIIKEELMEIEIQIAQLFADHNAYREMLQTLRKDELQARERLNELKRMLLDTSRSVQQSNIPGLPIEFGELIDKARKDVQKVTNKLDEIPLNMTVVIQLLDEAVQSVESLKEFADALIEQVLLIEQVIQYGNRYRSRNQELASRFREAEDLFRDYDYSKALDEAVAALEQVEPGSFHKVQELYEEQYSKPKNRKS